ncbi:transcriptional regulator family: Fungal Specific TF [Penicillium desertorum]|uniref:Transcriptional regulator family: Fungal Specific TF n=1 Tax=Penicillium desertorum TaxID=1303715 RepID=A0A9W9X9B8_9EURO|nr:transcriptional regulator family: Fungal Specific TF [Penicillium desertorum]
MTVELKDIVMLCNYGERCQSSKSGLNVPAIKLQSVSSNGIATDNELRFEPVVWHRIYDGLGLDVPFGRFPHGRSWASSCASMFTLWVALQMRDAEIPSAGWKACL